MIPSKFDRKKEELTFFVNEEDKQTIITNHHADSLTGFLASVSSWQREVITKKLKEYKPITIWVHGGFISIAGEFTPDINHVPLSDSFGEVVPF